MSKYTMNLKTRSKIVFTLILVLAMTSIYTTVVSGYVLLGATWVYYQPLTIYEETDWDSNLDTAILAWHNKNIEPSFSISGTPLVHHIGIKDVYKSNKNWIGMSYIQTFYSIIVDVNVELNDYYMDDDPVNQRISTIAHELGHCLGLDHTTGAVLMYPTAYATYGVVIPQTDDVNGVNAMY